MYATALARRAGYSHRITLERRTKFLGWQPESFDTTGDAVDIHLTCLYIQQRFGSVRNINVTLIASL